MKKQVGALEVSVEALGKVKAALRTFREDIHGMGTAAVSRSQECLQQCEQILSQTKQKIQKYEAEVQALTRKIEELEERIVASKDRVFQIERELQQLERRIRDQEDLLSSLEGQLADLRSQLSCEEDGECRQLIQSQIDAVQGQIGAVRQNIEQMKNQISMKKEEKYKLRQMIDRMQSEQSETRNRLSSAKRTLGRYQMKLEKLDRANRHIESDFSAYVRCVRKFEDVSSESVSMKHKAVDDCIALVEQMEAVF